MTFLLFLLGLALGYGSGFFAGVDRVKTVIAVEVAKAMKQSWLAGLISLNSVRDAMRLGFERAPLTKQVMDAAMEEAEQVMRRAQVLESSVRVPPWKPQP